MRLKNQNKLCKKQCGLSLIELLISLVLSSVVIVALFSFFSNFRANAHLQGSVVDNQHELRLISDFIRAEVHKAGYQNEMGTPAPPPLSIRVVSGNATTLTLSYQGDGAMRDCVGAIIPANNHEVVTLTLSNVVAGVGQIRCSNSQGGQVLLFENVSLLRFEYLNDGASAYSPNAGARVFAVKFSLALNHPIYNSGGQMLQKQYTQVAAIRNVIP